MNLEEYKYLVNSIPVAPFGIGTAQNWNQLGSLFEDLDRFHVTSFFELGVFMGGLADLMLYRQQNQLDFNYLGVQLLPEELHKRLKSHPQILIGSIFDGWIMDKISDLISINRGTVMVYCDGGDKPKELRTYTTFLRIGDYIRAHDFPGESTPESLEKYAKDFPYMHEIEPNKCRELGFTLWKRIG